MPRSDVTRRPTLLDSCARAATTAEARFRIDYPDVTPRASRIVALDDAAAALVRTLAAQSWHGGHFLIFEEIVPVDGSGAPSDDAVLRTVDGTRVSLTEELVGADLVVMVATARARTDAAAVIGDASAAYGIMSAGLVLTATADQAVDDVVQALRPNAMVLVILSDVADVPEILTALRV